MAQKIKDLAVKTGEYHDAVTGETKGRYENVGAIMKNDEGNAFMMLKRTFNPAGVPNPDNRDSVLISMFDPKPRDDQPRQQAGNGQQASSYRQASQGGQEPPPPSDSDIPY